MKTVDMKTFTYIEFSVRSNIKDLNLRLLGMSKSERKKYMFSKGFACNKYSLVKIKSS